MRETTTKETSMEENNDHKEMMSFAAKAAICFTGALVYKIGTYVAYRYIIVNKVADSTKETEE
jgi:hypothetical protein